MNHNTSVIQDTQRPMRPYRAVCSCGWFSTWRTTDQDAIECAATHSKNWNDHKHEPRAAKAIDEFIETVQKSVDDGIAHRAKMMKVKNGV